ncbi:cytochrome P450 [Streptomyces kronopolitis]|uniref:cytochrome P450 n=1 Tax=Streptomyces kronopolitis TaxID=1612435 RepID=UPI0034276C31
MGQEVPLCASPDPSTRRTAGWAPLRLRVDCTGISYTCTRRTDPSCVPTTGRGHGRVGCRPGPSGGHGASRRAARGAVRVPGPAVRGRQPASAPRRRAHSLAAAPALGARRTTGTRAVLRALHQAGAGARGPLGGAGGRQTHRAATRVDRVVAPYDLWVRARWRGDRHGPCRRRVRGGAHRVPRTALPGAAGRAALGGAGREGPCLSAWDGRPRGGGAPPADRVAAELDQVLGERTTPEYGELRRLTHLDRALKESLRLFPPGPYGARVPSFLMLPLSHLSLCSSQFVPEHVVARFDTRGSVSQPFLPLAVVCPASFSLSRWFACRSVADLEERVALSWVALVRSLW